MYNRFVSEGPWQILIGSGDTNDVWDHHSSIPAPSQPQIIHTRSTHIAMPMPPPIHKAATPLCRFRASSAWSRVTRIRAPEAPMGWPNAMAPPFTFTWKRNIKLSDKCHLENVSNWMDINIFYSPSWAKQISVFPWGNLNLQVPLNLRD